MYQIDRVTAINRMRQCIDGVILSNLNVDPQDDVTIQCVNALELATDKVQVETEWNFNTVGEVTLTADVNGAIALPSDYLQIFFTSWTNGLPLNLGVVGHKVWDQEKDSLTPGGTVRFIGERRFAIEEMPYALQNLVVEKAKIEYNGLATHLSAPRVQIAGQLYTDALTAALKWDSEFRGGVIDWGTSLRQQLRQRPNGGQGGWPAW